MQCLSGNIIKSGAFNVDANVQSFFERIGGIIFSVLSIDAIQYDRVVFIYLFICGCNNAMV